MRVLDELRQYMDALHQLLSGELEAEHRRVMQEFEASLAGLLHDLGQRQARVREAGCQKPKPPRPPRPPKAAKPAGSPDADTVGTVRNQRSPGPFVHSVPGSGSRRRR